jgi:hypothetical protein
LDVFSFESPERNLPLYVINYASSHKDVWGSGGIVLSFTPRPLNPWERAPATQLMGGFVGLTVCLDAVENRIVMPLPGIKLLPFSP